MEHQAKLGDCSTTSLPMGHIPFYCRCLKPPIFCRSLWWFLHIAAASISTSGNMPDSCVLATLDPHCPLLDRQGVQKVRPAIMDVGNFGNFRVWAFYGVFGFWFGCLSFCACFGLCLPSPWLLRATLLQLAGSCRQGLPLGIPDVVKQVKTTKVKTTSR